MPLHAIAAASLALLSKVDIVLTRFSFLRSPLIPGCVVHSLNGSQELCIISPKFTPLP